MLHKPYQTLKGELLKKNIKYSELAKLLDVSITTISNKINGSSDFLISEVDKIETHYGILRKFFTV